VSIKTETSKALIELEDIFSVLSGFGGLAVEKLGIPTIIGT
jgi:hypothetical protein